MSNVDEIKQRIDIVDIISDYIPLQKAGRNFKALCPFHHENHPSFFVFPEQQTWHCFGACGMGGDVFSFIMQKEGINFSEALQLLASRAGIKLTDSKTPDKVQDNKKQRLFQLNATACEYYHYLLVNTKAGEKARNYLNTRKISLQTAKEFHLGYSPGGWDTLKVFLTGKNYDEEDLKEAGLVIERETGGSYDRFRNHLMFPIYNDQGYIMGFGARTLDGSLPKYVNSPQTLIFDKGSSIYGIDKAKPFIKKEGLVIIMEGYIDVLTAHQHGWQNTIAAMGTSLTENQVAITRKLARKIALALDSDTAGEEATLRSTAVIAGYLDKTEVSVIEMPAGKDPDEVISENPELWQKLTEESVPILDFALKTVTSRIDRDNAKDKTTAVQKLLPLIDGIKDPVQQSHYERKLARILDIEETSIRATLEKWHASSTKRHTAVAIKQSEHSLQNKRNPVEEYCLILLYHYPELSSSAYELSAEYFENPSNREIFTQWQCFKDYTVIRKHLDPTLLVHLDNLICQPVREMTTKDKQHAFSECVLRLQERQLKKMEAEKAMMLEATREQEGAIAEIDKLDKQGISRSEQIRIVQLKRREITRGKDNGSN